LLPRHRKSGRPAQVRRAEWEMLINRDFEALAAENYMARWNR
jgi:hypothetical protein